MIENILFFCHYILLLAFGVVLTFSFTGIRFSRKNIFSSAGVFVFCGIIQLFFYILFGEDAVWKFYPLIIHLPIILVLLLFYKKRISTTLSSVSLAYLCCQPAKWFGIVTEEITNSAEAGYAVRMVILFAVGFSCIFVFGGYIAEIFNKDDKSVWIFGTVPAVYYIFDYTMGVYTDLLDRSNPIAIEFLPFFVCAFFMVFCVVYYKEYEKKADAQRNEQIMNIKVEQQAKEIEAFQRSHTETRLLRHDMRLMLSSLALSIEQNDRENALNIISGFISRVEASALHRYCENDTINYILTSYEAKCRESKTEFTANVEIGELKVDEAMFASIISNALDNALNAQADLDADKRKIKLMLKESEGKLLLSVKNPFKGKVSFADGLPVSDRKGHGLGTESIRYVAEKLGGKSQFTTQDDKFILRVIL